MSAPIAGTTIVPAPNGYPTSGYNPLQRVPTSAPLNRYIAKEVVTGTQLQTNNVQLDVKLPFIDMLLKEMYLEMDVKAIPTTPTAKLEPTYTWVEAVQLSNGSKPILVFDEATLVDFFYFNAQTYEQFTRDLETSDDQSYSGEGFSKKRSGNNRFFLNLRPIVARILKNIGPLDSYPQSKLRLQVRLKRMNQLTTLPAAGPAVSVPTDDPLWIKNTTLVLVGTRPDEASKAEFTRMTMSKGIETIYEQANQTVDSIASGFTGKKVVTLPSVSGDIPSFTIYMVDGDAWDATDPRQHRNLKWITGYKNWTVSLGTTSNPYQITGDPPTIRELMEAYVGDVYNGSTYFVDQNGETREPSIVKIPQNMYGTIGAVNGVWSGIIGIQGSLKVTIDIPPGEGPSTKVRLVIIVYNRQQEIIGAQDSNSAIE